jgi:hypothetical protein
MKAHHDEESNVRKEHTWEVQHHETVVGAEARMPGLRFPAGSLDADIAHSFHHPNNISKPFVGFHESEVNTIRVMFTISIPTLL